MEEHGGSLPSFLPVEPLLLLLLLLLTLLLLLLFDVDDSGSASTGAEDVTAPEGAAESPEGCGDWTEADMVAAQADLEEESDSEELEDDIVLRVRLGCSKPSQVP